MGDVARLQGVPVGSERGAGRPHAALAQAFHPGQLGADCLPRLVAGPVDAQGEAAAVWVRDAVGRVLAVADELDVSVAAHAEASHGIGHQLG